MFTLKAILHVKVVSPRTHLSTFGRFGLTLSNSRNIEQLNKNGKSCLIYA